MNFLIIGQSSSIGTNLIPILKKKGHIVEVLKSDIRDYDSLRKEFVEKTQVQKFDYSINLAAIVSSVPSDLAGRHVYDVNVRGSFILAELSKEFGMKHCHFSTTVLYKVGLDIINENSPKEPESFYAHTKLLGEMAVEHVFKDKKENILIVRPCFTYGINSTTAVISHLIKSSITKETVTVRLNPDYKKDYTYVDDFCEAVELLLLKNSYGDFNITSGEYLTFREILEKIEKVTNCKLRMYERPELDYLKDHIVSNEKIMNETGWIPKINLEKGIELIYNNIKNK